MVKLKFNDVKKGDWIYWFDDSRFFVSNVISIEKRKEQLCEDWWKLDNTINKFNKIKKNMIKSVCSLEDFERWRKIRRMTKKEIEDFKNKLILNKL